MNIQSKPMGPYQTNCYIVTIDKKDLIIDPGVGATDWVLKHIKNPIAILNTHGHFDHIWSNQELKQKLNIPIFCPEADVFMLEKDPFGQGTPNSNADVSVKPDEVITIEDISITFLHFPGHTPGCSAIEIGDNWFCGDFLFKGSIGRVDFPYSNPEDMKKSLKKAMNYKNNVTLYPGHGPISTLETEKRNISYWLRVI
ncbi:MAG TPA: MBL fold metallo-hydrolase [Sulfurimonas autotrophica]|nr:MBL fold metallo-hydrolase [Sulfurimonas autotrophica]